MHLARVQELQIRALIPEPATWAAFRDWPKTEEKTTAFGGKRDSASKVTPVFLGEFEFLVQPTERVVP